MSSDEETEYSEQKRKNVLNNRLFNNPDVTYEDTIPTVVEFCLNDLKENGMVEYKIENEKFMSEIFKKYGLNQKEEDNLKFLSNFRLKPISYKFLYGSNPFPVNLSLVLPGMYKNEYLPDVGKFFGKVLMANTIYQPTCGKELCIKKNTEKKRDEKYELKKLWNLQKELSKKHDFGNDVIYSFPTSNEFDRIMNHKLIKDSKIKPRVMNLSNYTFKSLNQSEYDTINMNIDKFCENVEITKNEDKMHLNIFLTDPTLSEELEDDLNRKAKIKAVWLIKYKIVN